MNSSTGAPEALSTREMLSMVGQRGRPSGPLRFDGLNEVGSKAAFLARPDAENP
jgi:hypothetical protein